MALEFRGISFEDQEVSLSTRYPSFHGISFEDVEVPLPSRYPEFHGFSIEDNEEVASSRFPKFAGFSVEDVEVVRPNRFPQFNGIAFEDFWLYDIQIKVQDTEGNAIPDANLRVRSFGSAYGFNLNSDANGLATLKFRYGENHQLSIKHAGYKTYRHRFKKETDVQWEQTLWPIIPIVLLPAGKTAKPLNPHEPVHEIYD